MISYRTYACIQGISYHDFEVWLLPKAVPGGSAKLLKNGLYTAVYRQYTDYSHEPNVFEL